MALAYSLDLDRLANSYATHALTPTRVVCDVLAEIDRTRSANPAWLHVIARDALLARAAEVERRRAQGECLPLYGVPYAVKDNIDIAGEPTTAACPAYRYIASETAFAVELLEAAGAICVGKTNMDQFATGLVGTRSPYGACVNPFDGRYISGGSSSGSALAVALGHVSFALGTDTAGSGRVPAAFCNVVGLKPTRGLVSTRGVVPACRTLDCVSIFALTCEDAGAVLDVLAVHDVLDPGSRRETRRSPRTPGRPMRCGVLRAKDLRFFGDAFARDAYGRTLDTLRSLGASFVEIDYAPFAEAARLLYEGPWIAERLAAIEPFYRTRAEHIDPVVREVIGAADKVSGVDAFRGRYRLQALKRRCAEAMQGIDVLAVPSAGTIYRIDDIAADPIGRNTDLGYYTNFVNLLDLCALAVPGHFRSDALPSGLTLIGRAFYEADLAQWGTLLQRAAVERMGATPFALPPAKPPRAARHADAVTLAVVGAHLTGMPLNPQLTDRGARLLESAMTAPHYRLYALAGTAPPKPGLVRVSEGEGAAIEVELWSVPLAAFGSFVAEIPPPLAIGTLTLHDGREVKGFVCESHALANARDISSFGGWREYMMARGSAQRAPEQAATS